MHGDDVAARIGEGRQERIARLDHQVAIEDLVGAVAHRLDDRRSEGNVGHIVPVHHVEMDPVGTGFDHGLDFVAEAGEIGRQHRGCDYGFRCHGDAPPIGIGYLVRLANRLGNLSGSRSTWSTMV